MNGEDQVLRQLMATIEDRKQNPPPRSYTSMLFAGGVDKIGEKITEEAAEVIEAGHLAADPEQAELLTHEAADLIYHLLVLLGYRGITWESVERELAGRFGVSGLDEKAARSNPPRE